MGSREFLPEALWPGYDALVDLLQGVRPGDPVSVVCFVDPHGGVRVSEISWKSHPGRPGKNAWFRMNPWDAGVILGAEKFILSHGVEPSGDVDFNGIDRDRLLEMFS